MAFRSFQYEGAMGMTDFSVPEKESIKKKRAERKEKKEEQPEKDPNQELYLHRMIDRFGLLPESSPIVKDAQRALDLFRPYVNAEIKRVAVINSGEINALVFLDGDTIFIHRGLLKYLHESSKEAGYNFTLDQIVGIAGHEAGHLEQHTGRKNAEEGEKKEKTPNSKELEYDADRRATLLLEQAGLNPLEFVKVMGALTKLSDQKKGYSASHPRSYKRMTDVEAMLRSPETIASITRPLTSVSAEFSQTLEGEESYPHVDDQILRLQTPEDLKKVMATFSNKADQMEWIQHYALYEKYRIAREQIETAECKRDILYKAFFSNLASYLEKYLEINVAERLESHQPYGSEVAKIFPDEVKRDGLMAGFLNTYGKEAKHRRHPVKFIEGTAAYWQKNAADKQNQKKVRKYKTGKKIENWNEDELIQERRDNDDPENFEAELYQKFVTILAMIEDSIKYNPEDEKLKEKLKHKKEKLIALFNGVFSGLPDFSVPDQILQAANWQNILSKEDVDQMVESGHSAGLIAACLHDLGTYVDRFTATVVKPSSDVSVLESQQFRKQETVVDILCASKGADEDKQKIFDFILMRQAISKTFNNSDKSFERKYYSGEEGSYHKIFSSAEEAYPEFAGLCEAAGKSLSSPDGDIKELLLNDFLPSYLLLQEGRETLSGDRRSKKIEKEKLQFLCDASIQESQDMAEAAMKKYAWVADSSVGPETQLKFSDLSNAVAETGSFRQAHVQSILDAYSAKLASLLEWQKKIKEGGEEKTMAAADAENIDIVDLKNPFSNKHHGSSYTDSGVIRKRWGVLQVKEGNDLNQMMAAQAETADQFLKSLFEFFKSGASSTEDVCEFFLLLTEVKIRAGKTFTADDLADYCRKYPYLSLEYTLPRLMAEGVLPVKKEVCERILTALDESRRDALLEDRLGFYSRHDPHEVRKIFLEYAYAKGNKDVLHSASFDFNYVRQEKKSDEYLKIDRDDFKKKIEFFLSKNIPLWNSDHSFSESPGMTIMHLFLQEKTVKDGRNDDVLELDIPDDINWEEVLTVVSKYKNTYLEKFGKEYEQVFDAILSELGVMAILDKHFKTTKMAAKEGVDSAEIPTIHEWLKKVFARLKEFGSRDFHGFILELHYHSGNKSQEIENLVKELGEGLDVDAARKFIGYGYIDLFEYLVKAGVKLETLMGEFLEYVPPSQKRDNDLKALLIGREMTPELANLLLKKKLAPLPEGKELRNLNYGGLAMSQGELRKEWYQQKIQDYGKGNVVREYFDWRDETFDTAVKNPHFERRNILYEPSSMADIYRNHIDGRFTYAEENPSLKLDFLKKFVFKDEFFDLNPLEVIVKLAKINELIPEETAYKDYLIERLEKKSREVLGFGKENQLTPWFFKYASQPEVNPDKWQGSTPATFLYNFYRQALSQMNSSEKRIRMGRTAFEILKYQINEGRVSFDKELDMIQELFPEYSIARDQYLIELLEKAETPKQIEKVKSLILSIQPVSPDKKVAKTNNFIEKFEEGLAFFDRQERQHLFFWLIGHPDFKQPPDTIRYLGVDNQCTFDRLPKYFATLTFEEQKKFLRNIFRAENGILDESISKDEKQAQEANEILQQTVENMFNYLFPEDKVEEKYRSVYHTIFTTLMQELDPERRTQLVFAILHNFQEGQKPTVDDIMASILNMGVAFKKAAQILSERKDLLPASLCETLSRIKDDADPISKAAVIEVFRREDALDSIDSVGELIGTASVGQVHNVVNKEGKPMVGKIKSPVVDKYREEDVTIISKIIARLKEGHGFKVPDFADEIRHMLNEESDFKNESVNRDLLDPVFKAVNELPLNQEEAGIFKKIELALPKITESKGAVLIEEKAKGYSLNDLYYLAIYDRWQETKDPGVSEKTLARGKKVRDKMVKERNLGQYRGALKNIDAIYLRMVDLVVAEVFENGVFHADKHRGNIMLEVDAKVESATVTAIDFGNVVQISPENQGALKSLFRGLALGDADGVEDGIKSFVGKLLPDEAKQTIAKIVSENLGFKEKIERVSLMMHDYFDYGERKDFVNILKGLVSSFYIFEDMSPEKQERAMLKIASKFFE